LAVLVRLKESKVQSLKFKVEFRDFGHWTLDFGLFSAGFSVKEKDEASLPDGFRQDSLDAFILRFAGV
jgi:hypothetical protein